MIDVTHRPDVHMRLRTLELRLAHRRSPFACLHVAGLVAAVGLEPTTTRL